MGCGMSRSSPQPGDPHHSHRPISHIYTNDATSHFSAGNQERGRPYTPPAQYRPPLDTGATRKLDLDDRCDLDSAYSSPIKTSPTSPRFHNHTSYIDATFPDATSPRSYGHTGTASSVTGVRTEPRHVGRRSTSRASTTRMRSSGGGASYSSSSAYASPPGSMLNGPTGSAAFKRRMERRDEWTLRGAGMQGESDDERSIHRGRAVGMAR